MNDREAPRRGAVTGLIAPAAILVFCAAAYWQTTTFDRVPPILKRGIQPADFPQLVILLMAGLAIWVAATERAPAPPPPPRPALLSLALLPGFVLLAHLDLFLALGAFGLCLARLWGERRLWAQATVCVAVPLCVFLLFDLVFEVRFPRGLLTNLWYG